MTKIILFISDRMSVWVVLVVAALATIIGDLFAKYWSLGRRPLILWLALIGYFLGSLFYIPSLLKEGLVVTSIIWGLISTIGFIVLGIFLFKEQLNLWQTTGVVLGVLALLIFAFADK